jgi:tripartite-type tricarboxylate transporter receptor subunit TctC
VVDRLNADIVRALKDPDTVKLFRDQGVEVVGSSPAAFGQLVHSEVPKWTKVIKDADIKVE